MQDSIEHLINRYLKHLDDALRDLPMARRKQIVSDIAEHIQTARQALPEENEAQIRQILEEVGDVESIRQEAGLPPKKDAYWGERWAPWLLLLGGFFFLIGWFFGLILLWQSRVWSLGDKILATLVWPGGLATVVVFGGMPVAASSTPSSICTSRVNGSVHCLSSAGSPPHPSPVLIVTLAVIAVAAPLFVTWRLVHVASRS
jgi:hypothetical protein